METLAFSIIGKPHDSNVMRSVMNNTQLGVPNARVTAATIDDGSDDNLYMVWCENLMPGDGSVIARKFINATDDGTFTPITSFRQLKNITSRTEFMASLAKYQDGKNKVKISNRNWNKK